ncbi:hypothetical protein Nepgr_026017 [Nepenthes gracilis]|uniref:Secreted protein n=1 Tax=Nepenthes gracilis TaxID=150966 RepID=A0AAD3T7L7_NEPGR|nr:hypothetical protein Nepgr_026017 [Nepenthes gracilis]
MPLSLLNAICFAVLAARCGFLYLACDSLVCSSSCVPILGWMLARDAPEGGGFSMWKAADALSGGRLLMPSLVEGKVWSYLFHSCELLLGNRKIAMPIAVTRTWGSSYAASICC